MEDPTFVPTLQGDSIESLKSKYIDGVPGSLYLIESVSLTFAGMNLISRGSETADHQHENALHAGEKNIKDVILDPQPSNDVNDPLNWDRIRKLRTLVGILTYVFAMGFCCSTIFSGFDEITATTGISLSTLNQGVGYLYGFYGWGGPIIIPLALRFGQRPFYIWSLIVVIGVVVWTPYISTSQQWLASRILYGFFGAPVEVLCEVTISYLYFSHERGFYLGLYGTVLFVNVFVAPVCSGYIFNAGGLKDVSWFTAGVAGLALIIVFFNLEETNFPRKEVVERERQSGLGNRDKVSIEHQEKSTTPNDLKPPATDSASGSGSEENATHHRQLYGTPHSEIYRLGAFRRTYCTWGQMFNAVWRPFWLIIRFPVVLFAGLSVGASLAIYAIFVDTIGLVVGSPPYNFSSGSTGLVYLGPLVSSLAFAPVLGKLGDKLAIHRARKNNGVREPEQRLILSWLLVVIVPWAFIQWGVGATHGVQWFGLVWALGLIGIYSPVQAALSATYLLDSYKELSGEVLIAMILIRNSLNFGVGYATPPLFNNLSIQNAYLTLAFSAIPFLLLFVVAMRFGKGWRRSSKDTYWSYVADSAFAH